MKFEKVRIIKKLGNEFSEEIQRTDKALLKKLDSCADILLCCAEENCQCGVHIVKNSKNEYWLRSNSKSYHIDNCVNAYDKIHSILKDEIDNLEEEDYDRLIKEMNKKITIKKRIKKIEITSSEIETKKKENVRKEEKMIFRNKNNFNIKIKNLIEYYDENKSIFGIFKGKVKLCFAERTKNFHVIEVRHSDSLVFSVSGSLRQIEVLRKKYGDAIGDKDNLQETKLVNFTYGGLLSPPSKNSGKIYNSKLKNFDLFSVEK